MSVQHVCVVVDSSVRHRYQVGSVLGPWDNRDEAAAYAALLEVEANAPFADDVADGIEPITVVVRPLIPPSP